MTLDEAAAKWEGTPFVANSAIPGPHGGVCCHLGAVAVLVDAGVVEDRDWPKGSPRWGRNSEERMTKWVDENLCPPLVRLAEPVGVDALLPGDLIGFRWNRPSVNHLAVVLPGRRIFHAVIGGKVAARVDRLDDSPFPSLLAVAWRNPTWVPESPRPQSLNEAKARSATTT